ncbi:hypothetical protein OS493_035256 [Desmophyllum pertusum]|uniref:Uncharacterized protein n=1 Tax=Desmophyllum pertusum TaxID=174260 RepID=A0A9W9ZIL0_9CNID|nr:hypothetical protein OS493_035256 [Desmophyllum pertusum]
MHVESQLMMTSFEDPYLTKCTVCEASTQGEEDEFQIPVFKVVNSHLVREDCCLPRGVPTKGCYLEGRNIKVLAPHRTTPKDTPKGGFCRRSRSIPWEDLSHPAKLKTMAESNDLSPSRLGQLEAWGKNQQRSSLTLISSRMKATKTKGFIKEKAYEPMTPYSSSATR